MENEFEGVKNYNIAVKKRGDDITFLRRIVRGGADGSYGIEVAKLAGIPENVIKRAKTILKTLEDKNSILYQCPERFANVIKNFYIALHDNPDAKYNNAVMLKSFVDGFDDSNIEKIYNAIMGIKNEEILSEK